MSEELLRMMVEGISDTIAGRAPRWSGSGDMAALEPDLPSLDHDHDMDEPDGGDGDDGPPRSSSYEPQKGSDGPVGWGGYQNGRIPDSALKSVGQGGHKMEAAAADSFKKMVAAAKADGVSIRLTDSYRSYDQQVDVRKRKGHVVATAKPGTSVHGWGKAVDINVNDPEVLRWLEANGGRFGFVNPAWARRGGKSHEPWHWEYRGGAAEPASKPAAKKKAPAKRLAQVPSQRMV